jgi:integrase
MVRPRQLSAAFIKTVKDAGAYGDGRGGHGLTLLVKMGAGRVLKSWYQRIRIDGQPVNMGLGAYPVVTLSDARAKALANARLVAREQDPRQGATSVPTLREAADKVIALHAANWKDGGKSAAQWQASLDAYTMPRLGSRPVDRITTADVMAVLMPIWNEKRETARRVRQRLSAVMKWAVAQGYRDDNPAGDAIGAALPKNVGKREHQRALAHGDVARALQAIRETNAWVSTKLALEFAALTACRSGEVRGARWREVDPESATWTVPKERMKAGTEHRVPLSDRALAVLAEARGLSDGAGLVFPSATDRQLTDNTLSKLLRENCIDAVPHGFRSSFRDWCGDSGVAREVAEACLAHVVKNQVEAAYARSDLLERRREVMQKWADYVSKIQ